MKRQRTSSRGSRGGSTPPQLPSPKRQHLADATASDLNIVQGTPTRQHSPVAFEKPVSDLKGDEGKILKPKSHCHSPSTRFVRAVALSSELSQRYPQFRSLSKRLLLVLCELWLSPHLSRPYFLVHLHLAQ